MKKFLAILLALCCALPLAACGEAEDGGKTKNNVKGADKTQIEFINFNGGVGSVWLENAAEEFATIHKDDSFAPGKTGVYINISKSMGIDTANMGDASFDIYTAEQFVSPNALAQQGKLYSIDDLVRDTDREGGSLDSIIYETAKGNLQGNDGKYYGLPHYESYGGLSYNYLAFNDIDGNGSGAFFADDSDTAAVPFTSTYSDGEYLFTTSDGVLSKGPDGKANTEDDGLPASLEEFMVLMDYIAQSGKYAPVVLSGKCSNYANYFIAGLWGALAGKEQMTNYYNCTGRIEVVKRTGEGGIAYTTENLFKGIDYIKKPQTEWVEMTEATGYLGNDMAAKFYALSMLEIMQKEGFFSTDTNNPNKTHYDAQMALYAGSDMNYKDAAMLIEASYWYNENREGGCFNKLKVANGKTEADIDVRVFSLPSSYYYDPAATGHDTAFVDISMCYLFVNKNLEKSPEKEKAVLEFLKFLYSTEQLQAFTATTGMPRALSYDLTAEQKSQVGNFYRRMWEVRNWHDGSNVVYWSGSTSAFRQAKDALKLNLFGDPLRTTDGSSNSYEYVKALGASTSFDRTAITKVAWDGLYKAA